jgi:N-methylhydantoinase B
MRMLARTLVSSTADRQELGPWPVDGGERGRPNRYWMITNAGEEMSLKERFGLSSNSKFANVPFDEGEQLVIDSAGGGGYGAAAERDPAADARDREYGYVTASARPG